jgi:hypothetical protein
VLLAKSNFFVNPFNRVNAMFNSLAFIAAVKGSKNTTEQPFSSVMMDLFTVPIFHEPGLLDL